MFSLAGSYTLLGDGDVGSTVVSANMIFTGTIEIDGLSGGYNDFLVNGGGTATFDGGTFVSLLEVQVGNSGGDGSLAFIDNASATLTATNRANALHVGFYGHVYNAPTRPG